MAKQKSEPTLQEISKRLDTIEKQSKLDQLKLGSINEKLKSLKKSMGQLLELQKGVKKKTPKEKK